MPPRAAIHDAKRQFMRTQFAIHADEGGNSFKKAPPRTGVPGICRDAAISLALPLVSKLPDGCGGDADRIPLRAKRGRSPIR